MRYCFIQYWGEKSLFVGMFLRKKFDFPATPVVSISLLHLTAYLSKFFLQIHSLSFLNVRIGNLSFLSTQRFFNNISSPLINMYQHLSNPKTTKVKLPNQIKSSGNQPNPIVLKTAKQKNFQQNTNPSRNYYVL